MITNPIVNNLLKYTIAAMVAIVFASNCNGNWFDYPMVALISTGIINLLETIRIV